MRQCVRDSAQVRFGAREKIPNRVLCEPCKANDRTERKAEKDAVIARAQDRGREVKRQRAKRKR